MILSCYCYCTISDNILLGKGNHLLRIKLSQSDPQYQSSVLASAVYNLVVLAHLFIYLEKMQLM